MVAMEPVTCSHCNRTFTPSPTFDFYPDRDSDDPDAGSCENCMLKSLFANDSSPKRSPSSLPAGYEETVCLMGKGAAVCSFLAFSGDGFRCAKDSELEVTIRRRLQEGSMVARGDNCSGPPDFTKTSEHAIEATEH